MPSGRGAVVVDLAEVDAGMTELVGGKAAALGEMLRAGFPVPDGFCVTTRAHRSGAVPAADVLDAYRRLGSGPVAVRSSATAEDLPDASFAGQHDTFLDVDGPEALLEAVQRCWDSLHGERAVAYREANRIDHGPVRMAVVVQRMVDAGTAGVLFTANPLTGSRAEMVVDAAPGLGTAVVDGSVNADHYVLGNAVADTGGCLGRAELTALRELGSRLQEHFGIPQDVEWAFDRSGTLWALQSRAITTLFPLPPPSGGSQPRVYFEMGHMQGMLRPFTPLGMSAMRLAAEMWLGPSSAKTMTNTWIVDVGGHLYADWTDFLRSRWTRKQIPAMMRTYGPRCEAIALRLLEDPRFAPQRGMPLRLPWLKLVRLVPAAVAGIGGSLARPEAARARAFHRVEEIRRESATASRSIGTAERFRLAEKAQEVYAGREIADVIWPMMTGLLVDRIARGLLRDIAGETELDTVLRGLPHNITTIMDLALWQVVRDLDTAQRELLSSTPPAELADRYRNGELPDIGLTSFLAEYGNRCAAEVDIGVPRWAEDPAPVFAAIANYLKITDQQAPDERFARAAEQAEAAVGALTARARRRHPVRGRLAGFLLRRTRQLTGLRELAKFAWVHPLAEMRRQLLLAGEDLAANGVLDRPGDVVFLELEEIRAAIAGCDQRELARARKATYQREITRRQVPVALLSDGTDLEAIAPRAAADGAWTGLGASPGTATGRARVILDPAGARIEPGEILVAPTTDPGWTPLFMTAAGLVTETGSPIAHGPTVAREYGIPAVICVRDATRRIETGQLITVDGTAGTITPGAIG
ncbi:pyruvate, water dikinase [Saccharopolyspora indica]|uniref:PEP/pyruvate-binding domain-containing protein n=1 Tax=Saccharopolyspora indica TaxID=1229659 RepID=UPI0022EAF0F4|nr:PEP/pyruvate-binding domain-containing protein [Saccharopolyspora indica]MDA3643944.1 PEP-utilizing enzyme [Saccharopolyspora indica]